MQYQSDRSTGFWNGSWNRPFQSKLLDMMVSDEVGIMSSNNKNDSNTDLGLN